MQAGLAPRGCLTMSGDISYQLYLRGDETTGYIDWRSGMLLKYHKMHRSAPNSKEWSSSEHQQCWGWETLIQKKIVFRVWWEHRGTRPFSDIQTTGKYTTRAHYLKVASIQFSCLFNHVWLFVTPWTAAHQASLSITNSWSLLKLMSIELVTPSNHLIFCCPLLLPPSIFPSIRVFSNESVLPIRRPKDWSFSFSICPSNENSGLISLGLTGWISLQSKGFSRDFLNTTVQKHQFFSIQLSL